MEGRVSDCTGCADRRREAAEEGKVGFVMCGPCAAAHDAEVEVAGEWKGVVAEAKVLECTCADPETGQLGWVSKHTTECPEYWLDQDDMRKLLRRAVAHGMRIAVHPMLDAADAVAVQAIAIERGEVEP